MNVFNPEFLEEQKEEELKDETIDEIEDEITDELIDSIVERIFKLETIVTTLLEHVDELLATPNNENWHKRQTMKTEISKLKEEV